MLSVPATVPFLTFLAALGLWPSTSIGTPQPAPPSKLSVTAVLIVPPSNGPFSTSPLPDEAPSTSDWLNVPFELPLPLPHLITIVPSVAAPLVSASHVTASVVFR